MRCAGVTLPYGYICSMHCCSFTIKYCIEFCPRTNRMSCCFTAREEFGSSQSLYGCHHMVLLARTMRYSRELAIHRQ